MFHSRKVLIAIMAFLAGGAVTPLFAQSAGWLGTDVGPVGVSGSSSFTGNGRLKVSAEGTDIWSTEDGFHFVYQTLPGDGEIKARVSSLQNTDPWAKAGLMFRQDLDAGAINAALVVTPANGVAFQQRGVAGGATVSQVASGKVAVWLRLVRAGSSISAFASNDGTNWTSLGTRTVSLEGAVLVGMAVTSHRPSKLTNGWFESITLDQTTAQAPPPSGPVAAYAFDEGMGSTLRDSAGAHHGTVAGASWTKSGRHGGALTFDGLDDIVTVKDATALRLSSEMTVSAWVNPSTLSGWRGVVGKEGTGELAYGLYANNDVLRPTGILNTGTTDSQVSCAKQLTVGAWSHVAVTYDGQTARFFVNGAEAGNRAVGGTLLQTNGALRIGGNAIWGEWFHGSLDDLRIYDRALSSDEIQADMSTAVPSTPLVDTTPPVVAITSPADGATVSGTVTVAANATDDIELASVQFRLNGSNLGPVVTSAPFTATFDTKTVANGSHTLTAVATDAAGNQATSATVSVTVGDGDTTPPTVAITSPANGATVSGTISVTASATDDVQLAGVQFRLNGSNLGPVVTSAPFTVTFDTKTVANGSHTLTAVATDAAGNQATSATVSVTVSNGDTTPPIVAITNPANGTTVSGTISVTASATDNVQLAGVQFRLNGGNLGTVMTVAPFALTFNTTTVANGAYTLSAVASDAAGNQTTSAPVSITVSNAAPVVNVKTVEFTSTDHAAVLSDGRPVVSGYTLEIWTAGSNTTTATPYRTSNLGKPSSTSTTISVNQETFLASLPKGQQFFATITASGPGGTARSSASNTFSLQ